MNVVDRWKRQLGALTGRAAYDAKGSRDAAAVAYARRMQRSQKERDHLTLPFHQLPVVVFDIETTGFSPRKGDTILSIGAVKLSGEKKEEFYSLLYSENDPPLVVKELTGISREELIEAPAAENVLTDFLSFIQGHTLVAHHASHEKAFMNHSLWSLFRTRFDYRLLDTTFLTRLIPSMQHMQALDDCCNFLNIALEERHHALADARITSELWLKCVGLLEQQGYVNLKDIYAELAKQRH
ncbi:exonuclease domain-containing protein [Alkalicoccus daliensis]|uniref:DNA polymerase-3 subunit epsilon n=1 Tax=Alkalicoccus daliensis TaxID=745820 RepID=A0A1H0AIN4_9BACI|nr:exonuclease domain-containing protein [Alkalicoccus daliensis]SDN33231.1 DNA polymerase-3 subunit epsilon [Alkalicoccus daliensis]